LEVSICHDIVLAVAATYIHCTCFLSHTVCYIINLC
jgi:hypothetical protein